MKNKKKKVKKQVRKMKNKLPKPNTRNQEVLRLMLDSKKPLSYYDMAHKLKNINAHKAREYWQCKGVRFRKITIQHINRFGREIEFCKFEVTNRKHARNIYKGDF